MASLLPCSITFFFTKAQTKVFVNRFRCFVGSKRAASEPVQEHVSFPKFLVRHDNEARQVHTFLQYPNDGLSKGGIIFISTGHVSIKGHPSRIFPKSSMRCSATRVNHPVCRLNDNKSTFKLHSALFYYVNLFMQSVFIRTHNAFVTEAKTPIRFIRISQTC